MKVKILSKSVNPLLRRREVVFQVEHERASTPSRVNVKEAIATALRVDANLIFIKRMVTKTGAHTTIGVANVYDSFEQAKLVEPEYIIKRNTAPKGREEV